MGNTSYNSNECFQIDSNIGIGLKDHWKKYDAIQAQAAKIRWRLMNLDSTEFALMYTALPPLERNFSGNKIAL